jgi:hypothetical protein
VFLLYAMVYVILRSKGDVVHQRVPAQRDGQNYTEIVVGPDYNLPRWQRQLYRAVFTPLMVAEEEGRWLGTQGRDILKKAGEIGRQFLLD